MISNVPDQVHLAVSHHTEKGKLTHMSLQVGDKKCCTGTDVPESEQAP